MGVTGAADWVEGVTCAKFFLLTDTLDLKSKVGNGGGISYVVPLFV